eukprot:7004699-Ditylum_brightwellii.AAC.2
MAMNTAVEEVMAVCYMLRCFGVKVSKPTRILDDNRSVIINESFHANLSLYEYCGLHLAPFLM